MYATPGSGIYFNIGKSVALEKHAWCITPRAERKLFSEFDMYKAQGFDTIQYNHMDDLPCGSMASEIVWLRKPYTRNPCDLSTFFRTKWLGHKACNCSYVKDASNINNLNGCIVC